MNEMFLLPQVIQRLTLFMVLKSQNGKMIEEITTLGRKITPLQSHRDLQHHDWIVMTDITVRCLRA